MENDDAPNNQNSWLLFSLTPQMNIHLPSSSAPTLTQTIPTNLLLLPNSYALHDQPENASYSPLPVMEALSTSQPQGGSMLPLSLDSMAYNSSYCSAFRSHDLGNFFQASHITQESMAPYGDYNLQSLSCVTTSNRRTEKVDDHQNQIVLRRKSIHTYGQRTSQYRGVTRHRWTGRYEAHLWDNSCKKEGQSRKGRQVYLGGYDREEKAARAYDLAALKYWGPSTHINFPLENYENEVEEMKRMTRQEYVAHLRRKSSGFSRGASIYRGVTRHHQHGRWQARIGRVAGNKDLYLGTFSTQEEAGEAYDIAAIKFRGVNAVTNFDISRYDVEKIMASSNILSGDEAKRKSTNTGIIIDDNAANEEGNNNNNDDNNNNIVMHNISSCCDDVVSMASDNVVIDHHQQI